MTAIKTIVIIYNPHSTGDGQHNAETLQRDIAAVSAIPIQLQPTDHADHAEQMVRQLDASIDTLIVSSSGDGGYHDIINGILSHGDKAHHLIAGLLPSGNANDHYHALHHGDIVDRIIQNDIQTIDILKVTVGNWSRYAHSYAGIGLSPHIGEKLTAAKLTPLKEAWLVVKHFFTARPVKISVHGTTRRYDSLIFSNIQQMSKHMTLSKNARVDDGKFEVTGTRAGSFSKLVGHIFKASTVGLTNDARSVSHYQFTSRRPLALQLDGEVYHFAANSHITIEAVPSALRCII